MNLANDYPILITLLVIVGLLILGIRTAVTFARTPGVPLEVRGAALRIDGDRYGGPVPLMKLRLNEAREVDFATEPLLQPRRRVNSISVNSLRSGWFRLANGQSALIYLLPRKKVLYIPTTSDYVIMVSVDNPEQFLRDVNTRRGATE